MGSLLVNSEITVPISMLILLHITARSLLILVAKALHFTINIIVFMTVAWRFLGSSLNHKLVVQMVCHQYLFAAGAETLHLSMFLYLFIPFEVSFKVNY